MKIDELNQASTGQDARACWRFLYDKSDNDEVAVVYINEHHKMYVPSTLCGN